MNIIVTQTTNTYTIRTQKEKQFRISVAGGNGSVAGNLSDLQDFDPTGVQNGYVITYDANAQKYIAVNPDQVLSSAASDGLPTNFINVLDKDLDDKIDLDAGTF